MYDLCGMIWLVTMSVVCAYTTIYLPNYKWIESMKLKADSRYRICRVSVIHLPLHLSLMFMPLRTYSTFFLQLVFEYYYLFTLPRGRRFCVTQRPRHMDNRAIVVIITSYSRQNSTSYYPTCYFTMLLIFFLLLSVLLCLLELRFSCSACHRRAVLDVSSVGSGHI